MINLSPDALQKHTEKMEAFYADIETHNLKHTETVDQCIGTLLDTNERLMTNFERERTLKNRTIRVLSAAVIGLSFSTAVLALILFNKGR